MKMLSLVAISLKGIPTTSLAPSLRYSCSGCCRSDKLTALNTVPSLRTKTRQHIHSRFEQVLQCYAQHLMLTLVTTELHALLQKTTAGSLYTAIQGHEENISVPVQQRPKVQVITLFLCGQSPNTAAECVSVTRGLLEGRYAPPLRADQEEHVASCRECSNEKETVRKKIPHMTGQNDILSYLFACCLSQSC